MTRMVFAGSASMVPKSDSYEAYEECVHVSVWGKEFVNSEPVVGLSQLPVDYPFRIVVLRDRIGKTDLLVVFGPE